MFDLLTITFNTWYNVSLLSRFLCPLFLLYTSIAIIFFIFYISKPLLTTMLYHSQLFFFNDHDMIINLPLTSFLLLGDSLSITSFVRHFLIIENFILNLTAIWSFSWCLVPNYDFLLIYRHVLLFGIYISCRCKNLKELELEETIRITYLIIMLM